MNALKIFVLGFKERVKNAPRIVALICIIVVPALYPLFWLQAFWNPYDNIGNLPIAFVNEDVGALGASLQEELENDTSLSWNFVGRKTAEEGLINKEYYAVYVVPANFSERTATMQTAHLEAYVDGKNNFLSTLLASQIGARLETKLSQQVSLTTADKLSMSKDLAAFLSNPIDYQQIDLNPLPNNGTGFAPYFSSLALWIGALLISMVAGKQIGGQRWHTFGSLNAIAGRYLLYAVIGMAQSAVLMVVFAVLEIAMSSALMTFAMLVVCSLCCIALVSLLTSVFGRFGQILSMLVLLLQLTASGGTYPIQLAGNELFASLHPFMPFTYSVNALRETISGKPIDGDLVAFGVMVQLCVITVCFVVCVLTRRQVEKGMQPTT
jgi:putative membrane protein